MEMKKYLLRALFFGGLIVGPGFADAADVEVAADLVSAYLFRGATKNDGPVLQPAVTVADLPLRLKIGVWSNLDLDDYEGALEKGEFSEIDLSATLSPVLPLDDVILDIGVVEYVYPIAEEEADREVFLVVEHDRAFRPRLSMYYGLAGARKKAFYSELGVLWQTKIDRKWVLSVGGDLAWRLPDGGSGGISHYQLAGSLNYGIFNVSLAYTGRLDDEVLPDAEADRNGGMSPGYDTRFVASAGVAIQF